MSEIQMAAITLLGSSIIIVLAVLWRLIRFQNFRSRAVETVATVTHAEMKRGYKGAIYFILSVQYADQAGNRYSATIRRPRRNNVGDSIPIFYKPGNATNFKTDGRKRLRIDLIASLVFLVFAIGFFLWATDK